MRDARHKARIAQIAALNDQARRVMGFYCRVHETPAFRVLSVDDKQAVRRSVESYDGWDAITGFVGERDYGILYKCADGQWTNDPALAEKAILIAHWKIDYYDPSFKRLSKAPWDIKRTGRVLLFSLDSDDSA